MNFQPLFFLKKTVVVIIPIYQKTFSSNEEISLNQVFKVLSKHPIRIIKPASLSIEHVQKKGRTFEIEEFDDYYFQNTNTYNQLLLSTSFYKRFQSYKYMLIYQTDAFVFRDELLSWCSRGYDYIGAPIRTEIQFFSKWEERIWMIKKYLARWFHLTETLHGNHQPKEIVLKRTVGNGGFSLRKIDKMVQLIEQHPKTIKRYLSNTSPFYNEDIFFSIEMNRYIRKVRTPSWLEALEFAIEDQPTQNTKMIGKLPFGCHAWDIYEPEFWKNHIQNEGYLL